MQQFESNQDTPLSAAAVACLGDSPECLGYTDQSRFLGNELANCEYSTPIGDGACWYSMLKEPDQGERYRALVR